MALGFLAWCTLTAISRPGLQYDESIFVNAALGGHYAGGSFVSDRFHGIPTMVVPYTGALKSWLYAPVFDLFGVSVSSMRIPAIAIVFATVGLGFALGRRLFGAWPATVLAVLMATDPTYMTMAKADWGPVALSGLLRVAALAAYFAWLRTKSVRYMWLLAGAIVLGLFNKIDYLAFAASLAVVAGVVHHRDIVACVRRHPLASLLPTIALAAALVVEYVEIYVPARAFPAARSHADLIGRVSEVWTLFQGVMDGRGVYQYMTTLPLGHRTAIVPATIGAVVLAAALATWRLLRGRRLSELEAPLADAAKTTTFFLLLLLVMAAALIATPQAVGPHHIMLLWPLPALLGVSLLAAATRMRPTAMRVGIATTLVLAATWLAATQVVAAEAYRAGFASDRAWSTPWTTEIYPLVRAVRGAAPSAASVVTADWGIGNQLIALGDDSVRVRLDDAWGTFATGPQAAVDQFAAAALRGRRVVVALHEPASEVMPATHARFAAMLRWLKPSRGAREIYKGRVLVAYVVDDRPRGG